jgi:hypothetical protein
MERIEPEITDPNSATKVWLVSDFCTHHRLDEQEEKKLRALFGQFATTCELVHNVRRKPKFR